MNINYHGYHLMTSLIGGIFSSSKVNKSVRYGDQNAVVLSVPAVRNGRVFPGIATPKSSVCVFASCIYIIYM